MASIVLTNLSEASSVEGIAGTRDPGGPRSAFGRCPVVRKYSIIRSGSTSSNSKSLNKRSGDLRGEGGPCRRVRTRETDRRPDILTERRKLTKQNNDTGATWVADTKWKGSTADEVVSVKTINQDRTVETQDKCYKVRQGRIRNTRANPNIVPPYSIID